MVFSLVFAFLRATDSLSLEARSRSGLGNQSVLSSYTQLVFPMPADVS